MKLETILKNSLFTYQDLVSILIDKKSDNALSINDALDICEDIIFSKNYSSREKKIHEYLYKKLIVRHFYLLKGIRHEVLQWQLDDHEYREYQNNAITVHGGIFDIPHKINLDKVTASVQYAYRKHERNSFGYAFNTKRYNF